ncbi:MAG: leucine-rich repeat domain-containing protein [Campylobacterota bacterium]|nr:leucine-rich repeat domain-containing protein [Campylobacterota bacterium]
MQSDKEIVEFFNWAREYTVEDILKICSTDILQNMENLQNLKSLDLSFKKLHSLPPYLFELVSLENLNLSHNQLKELPKEIVKLKSLKNLDISWNHIMHSLDFLPTNIKINIAWNRK